MRVSIFLFTVFLFAPIQSYTESYSDKNKRLFFITPSNGEEVTNPVTIRFGIVGMEIVPAGKDKPMSGHHHLLINVEKLPNMKSPIPADKNHLHFGKGQTETQLNLPSGRHTLQLLLGDYMHVPHEKPLISDKIEIIVK
jgi:hypothetical protein